MIWRLEREHGDAQDGKREDRCCEKEVVEQIASSVVNALLCARSIPGLADRAETLYDQSPIYEALQMRV